MTTLHTWIALIGLALVTILTRNFFLVLGDTLRLPERVAHALRYAPACALAGLIVPEVLLAQGQLVEPLTNPRLWGAAAALVTMLITRNMVGTMGVGMAVFTALRLLG